MFIDFNKINILFYSKPVDMRKAINGLSIIVSDSLSIDPSNGTLFIFYNKRHDRIKILYWHRNGYCLFCKCLDSGRFKIPLSSKSTIGLTSQQLSWLLDGLDLKVIKPLPRIPDRPLHY